MKKNTLLKAGLLALCCGAMAFSAVTISNQFKGNGEIEVTSAAEVEKTYFDKDYTSAAAKDYADADVGQLGFYAGHNLRTNAALFNIGGKSASGVYWVIKVDAESGNYLTELKLKGVGRFYYSSGQNHPSERFYLSEDGSNFGPEVSITNCLYGAYDVRDTIDVDFTSYLPHRASTIYVKFLLHCTSSSLGFPNEWTKWNTIKVTGKEIPAAEYVEPSNNFSRTLTENFGTTPLKNSQAYDICNAHGGKNTTHGIMPGIGSDPSYICDDLDSYITYFVGTNGMPISSVSLKLNAKIWNQNNGTCQNENKIKVLTSKDGTNFTLVKTYGCTDSGGVNKFVDLADANLSANLRGGTNGAYVRIQFVQSTAASSGTGVKAINGVNHDCHTQSWSTTGVKLMKVELNVLAKVKETYISKNFGEGSTDTLDDALNVVSWVKGCPESPYYGIYNNDTSTPTTAELTYKIEAKNAGSYIDSVMFSFSDSRYAYYSGSTPEVLKIYVSDDNVKFVEAASLIGGALKTAATLDGSDEAVKLFSSTIYVKVTLGPSVEGCGFNKCWAVLNKIEITGTEEVINAVEYSKYFITSTGEICSSGAQDNLTELQARWPILQTKYNTLDADEKVALATNPESNANITACLGRYDYICGKYNTASVKNLVEFIEGHDVVYASNVFEALTQNNMSLVIILVASSVSMFVAACFLINRKRKYN